MSTKHRRQRHVARGFCDKFTERCPDTVDTLAFKYMEMCKVDSSTDSESDTSPRWSDTSSKGFISSTTEARAAQKMPALLQKQTGRHHLLSLDPYDGSSEDSGSSADAPKWQKLREYRLRGRRHRVPINPLSFPKDVRRATARENMQELLLGDIQMRSSSDSEMKTAKLDLLSPSVTVDGPTFEMSEDSGANTKSDLSSLGLLGLNTDATTTQLTDGSSCRNYYGPSEASTDPPDGLFLPFYPFKRKLTDLLADMDECRNRKKQRVTEMEDESTYPEGEK